MQKSVLMTFSHKINEGIAYPIAIHTNHGREMSLVFGDAFGFDIFAEF